MARFPGVNESVIRHRGGGRDENGQIIPDAAVGLMAIAVAPGGGSEHAERLRSGENISCTVYFPTGADIVNSDELTVRGERFRIIVNDWRTSLPIGGVEVLCIGGQG